MSVRRLPSSSLSGRQFLSFTLGVGATLVVVLVVATLLRRPPPPPPEPGAATRHAATLPRASARPLPPAAEPAPTVRAAAPVSGPAIPVPGPATKTPWASRNEAYLAQLCDQPLSAPVRTILGLDAHAATPEIRGQALGQLTRNLTAADAAALTMFLDFRPDGQEPASALDAQTFDKLKTGVLKLLLEQENLQVGLGEHLAVMYRDQEHDAAWRRTCLERLPSYYERRWPANHDSAISDDPERTLVEGALWEAAEQTDPALATAAVHSLESLAGRYSRINAGKVRSAAEKLRQTEARPGAGT